MKIFENGFINTDEVMYIIPDRVKMEKIIDDAAAQTIIRNIVVDGLIPLYKPIGFQIHSGSSGGADRPIFVNRSSLLEDSNLHIMTNLSKLIFLPKRDISGGIVPPPKTAVIEPDPDRIINLEESDIVTSGDYIHKGPIPLDVLDTSIYLYTPMPGTDVSIKIIIEAVRGNTTLQDAIEYMDAMDIESVRSSLMGIPSRASLENYIKFIPEGGGKFNYKLLNGMTDDILNLIFEHGGDQILW